MSGSIRICAHHFPLVYVTYLSRLQIPFGGVSSDKSFPRAAQAGKRSFPSRLKAFVGSGNKYEEGIDFVGRLTKLLMFCSGPHTTNEADDAVMDSEESKLSEDYIVQMKVTQVLTEVI